MDTSKKYREMCRQAKEIQKQWRFRMGDFFYWSNEIKTKPEILEVLDDNYDEIDITCDIWLPRQDQLQNMIVSFDGTSLPIYGLQNLFEEFMRFCLLDKTKSNEIYDRIGHPKYIKHFDTCEQLWLAFVMEKNHHKRWNGRIWKEMK